MGFLNFDRLNETVGKSIVGRFFTLEERKTTFTQELRAGTVTFLTIAYILAVNSNILTDSGGVCSAADCTGKDAGKPWCIFDPTDAGYQGCLADMKKSFISATAASSLIACALMGLLGNLPLAVAPGMGINAFFTYTVVGFRGTDGMISYQDALAACFIEGWIFILISITGARGKLVSFIPKSIMLATGGGIGIFLAFIGLQTSNGIGLISYDSATLVTLGGCPIKDRRPNFTPMSIPDWVGNATSGAVCQVAANGTFLGVNSNWMGPPSNAYYCVTNDMRSGSLWLGIAGGALMVLLMARGFRGAIMTGILFVTFISWIPGHSATYLGEDSQIPFGKERLHYFKKVVAAPDISKSAVAWDFNAFGHADLWAALITFLYLDFLDCTGTLFSMATFIDKQLPGFIDMKTRSFPRQTAAFCVDGFSIVVGSLMGIAPLTVYIESATGIKEGGRTGITALMVAFFFFLALFFAPIIASIPGYATGPALILVGALMMENLLDIDWHDLAQAGPAFLTIVCIPLTYSIAYGVIAGLGSYIAFYVALLIYDLCTTPFTGRTVKEVLRDAVPDVLKPDRDGTASPNRISKDGDDDSTGGKGAALDSPPLGLPSPAGAAMVGKGDATPANAV